MLEHTEIVVKTCSVDGCENKTRTKSAEFCGKHYWRWWRYGDPLHTNNLVDQRGLPCSADGCEDERLAKELCSRHYWQWRNHGHFNVKSNNHGLSTDQRFWMKVNGGVTSADDLPEDECWIWSGASSKYGTIWDGSKQVLAHRWIYEQMVGEIPHNYELDHTCCVPLCVNPNHLEPVTGVENRRRHVERSRAKKSLAA